MEIDFKWETEELKNFKKLLATFVAIMDKNNNEKSEEEKRGHNAFIEGKKGFTGQGYNGDCIQKHIEDCCIIREGKVCISAQAGYFSGYLHFVDTCINIEFAEPKKTSDKLCVVVDSIRVGEPMAVDALSLFNVEGEYDKDTIKDELKNLMTTFYKAYLDNYINKTISILTEKKNIILQGASGTGKTYSVDQIIARICKNYNYNEAQEIIYKNHKEIVDWREKNIFNYVEKTGNVAFCTFHQSMEYEDFIEGIKPEIIDGKIGYKLEKGIFWQIATRAKENYEGAHLKDGEPVPEIPYILVIDEINRGNVSKIFGELITLLESGKRIGDTQPISAILPYSKEPFVLPPNLYIIGTMNTTDRSVGNLDYAVRRRFAFITVKSSRDIVEANVKESDVKALALALFDAINGKDGFIETHKIDGEMDSEDLKVGHSFFLADSKKALKLKMEYEVVPLLKEYIRDGLLSPQKEDDKLFIEWISGNVFDETTSTDSKALEYFFYKKNPNSKYRDQAVKLCQEINESGIIDWRGSQRILCKWFLATKISSFKKNMNEIVKEIKEKVENGEICFNEGYESDDCYARWEEGKLVNEELVGEI